MRPNYAEVGKAFADVAREPEVGHFVRAWQVRGQQDVARFDITVDDALYMEIGECREHLLGEVLGFRLLETLVVLKELLKITKATVFHDDV